MLDNNNYTNAEVAELHDACIQEKSNRYLNIYMIGCEYHINRGTDAKGRVIEDKRAYRRPALARGRAEYNNTVASYRAQGICASQQGA